MDAFQLHLHRFQHINGNKGCTGQLLFFLKSFIRADRGSIPSMDRELSLRHRVQTGSGVRPVSSAVGTRSSFPRCKAAGA